MQILFKHWHNTDTTNIHFNGAATEIADLEFEAARYAAKYPKGYTNIHSTVREATNEAGVMVSVRGIVHPPTGAKSVGY